MCTIEQCLYYSPELILGPYHISEINGRYVILIRNHAPSIDGINREFIYLGNYLTLQEAATAAWDKNEENRASR